MEVSACAVPGGEVTHFLHVGVVGGRQVCGAAHQGGDGLGGHLDHGAGRGAGGHVLLGDGGQELLLQVGWHRLGDDGVQQCLPLGIGVLPGGEIGVPLGGVGLLVGDELVAELADLGGHGEGLPGIEAQGGLGGLQFVFSQGSAVAFGGAGQVGGAVADGGGADDDGGLVLARLRQGDGRVDLAGALSVDLQDIPAVGGETRAHILAHGQGGISLDGDLVVVVEKNQVVQLQVAGQGAGLVAGALHDASVAGNHIDLLFLEEGLGGLDAGGQLLQADGHAHRAGQSGGQGAGGDLDAGGVSVLGVAGGLAAKLAEVLQVIQGDVVAEEVQQGVQQHGAVSRGEHEAVASQPFGAGGVEAKVLRPEGEGVVRAAHGHAGVAGVCLLHAVGGQEPDGVDGLLDDFLVLAAAHGSLRSLFG